jgi:hypothetical protein
MGAMFKHRAICTGNDQEGGMRFRLNSQTSRRKIPAGGRKKTCPKWRCRLSRLLRLVASLAVLWACPVSAEQVCFAPSIEFGEFRVEHCETPQFNYAEGWQGYGTTEPEACLIGFQCPTIDGPTGLQISRSSTNPFLYFGELPEGVSDLYVWLVCENWGMAELAFSLTGDLELVSFTPMNGFVDQGSFPDVHLTIQGCPLGPVVVGRITVQNDFATSADGHESATWGRVKALYANETVR